MSEHDLVLGLDIGGTKLAAGVVDATGRAQSVLEVPTPDRDMGWQHAMDALLALGDRAIEAAGVPRSRVSAVGIGSGGPLDSVAGYVMRPPNLPDWDDVPVVRLVEAAFGLPATLENDANAAALASHLWGDWAGVADLVYLTISTGIGGGVLINGDLLRGTSGNAAELGHIVIDRQGRECQCGQRGCAEAYASGTSIARRAREALAAGQPSTLSTLRSVTAADVSAAVRQGDGLARSIWAETTDILGILVTSVLNLFEPTVVVLGGGVTEAGAMLIEPVRQHARSHAISPAGRAAQVVITGHGRAVGVLGAAAAAMTNVRVEVGT